MCATPLIALAPLPSPLHAHLANDTPSLPATNTRPPQWQAKIHRRQTRDENCISLHTSCTPNRPLPPPFTQPRCSATLPPPPAQKKTPKCAAENAEKRKIVHTTTRQMPKPPQSAPPPALSPLFPSPLPSTANLATPKNLWTVSASVWGEHNMQKIRRKSGRSSPVSRPPKPTHNPPP